MNRKMILGIALIIIAFWSYTQILFQVKATPTYYGNFINSQLLESVGTVRKWVVNNSTVIYNGVYTHDYIITPSILLSTTDTLIVSVNSTGAGTFRISFFCNDYLNQLYYLFTDNYIGTKNYTMTINNFSILNGAPNLLDVREVISEVSTRNFNKMILIGINYYEVWDGSILKYQGLINPDINDFVTDVPTFTATNTIQLNTVYIGMIAGIIGAITALGLWWIGLLILAIDFTFLYQFLLDAKVITGYTIASNNQVITLVETYSDLRLFCVLILIAGCVCIVIGVLNKLMND
jgi:hypothetical protein